MLYFMESCVCVRVRVRVCVCVCLFPSTVEASPDWTEQYTIHVVPEFSSAM